MFYSLLSDRAILHIAGEDARSFLQGIISNDIYKVTPSTAIYALVLTPQGKYLYDLFIAEHNGTLFLDCAVAVKEALVKKLTMYKLRSKVTITEAGDYASLFLCGDNLPTVQPFLGGVCYNDPRNAALGARAIVPKANMESFLEQAGIIKGEQPYDLLRIRAGIAEGEKDMVAEKSFPLEYGMEENHAIDFQKGCYVGQEVTARTKYRGVLRKKIYRIGSAAELPAHGTEIMADTVKIGVVCSHSGTEGLALLRMEEYEQAIQEGKNLSANGQDIVVMS